MSPNTDRPRFRLELEPMADHGDEHEIAVCLRRLLKHIGRAWGFRCRSVEQIEPKGHEAQNTNDERKETDG